MFTTNSSGKILYALLCVVFSSFSVIGCEGNSTQKLQTALKRAEQRAQKAEGELKQVKAQLEKVKAQLDDTLPEDTKKLILENEKLKQRVARVVINNVQLDRKKKSMDININFVIYNRNEIECIAIVSFYRQDGAALYDKDGQTITIKRKFTPKRVTDTLTEKIPVSYDKLYVKQARDLELEVRIFDNPTKSYLEQEPYSVPFHYDP